MQGLYPIVDVQTCERHGLGPLEVARALLSCSPAILQLRAKAQPPRETLALLRELVGMTRGTPTLVFANDRPDLALMAGCDGVHLGQQDLPLEAVRALAPGLRVGLSTHSRLQLTEALAGAPDYVAYGPIFTTSTKQDAEPCVGTLGLRTAHAQALAARVPLVAIGGIDEDSLDDVAPHAELVCVISALMGSAVRDVAERAQRFAARVRSLKGAQLDQHGFDDQRG
jgi:thiamine-phosphate pyrophosphorylase